MKTGSFKPRGALNASLCQIIDIFLYFCIHKILSTYFLYSIFFAQSALSAQCKQAVHVNEILNTSKRLDWNDNTAPLLPDYMMRMKEAEYSENYRRIVLEKAFKYYDKIVQDEEDDRRPMHRPKHWQKEERMKEKRRKKHTWATQRWVHCTNYNSSNSIFRTSEHVKRCG
jgi:hypothetical protein